MTNSTPVDAAAADAVVGGTEVEDMVELPRIVEETVERAVETTRWACQLD